MDDVKKTREIAPAEIAGDVLTELFYILLPVFILAGIEQIIIGVTPTIATTGKEQAASLAPHKYPGVAFELLLSTMLFYANILRIVSTKSWAFASAPWRLIKSLATPTAILGLVFTGVLLADPKSERPLTWIIILCGVGLITWASVSWHMIDRQKSRELRLLQNQKPPMLHSKTTTNTTS